VTDVVISVVIPARDAGKTVGRTLDALAAQAGAPPFEIVFVDDGSRDGTADVVGRHDLGVRLIRKRGEGAGVARNAGAAAARGRLLAFTDADCEPTPRWLAAGFRAAQEADIVQGAVHPTPGAKIGPFDRTLSVVSEYGLYETANLFVHREWFDRVGGFTDWVGWSQDTGRPRKIAVPRRPFGEDSWFAWRAKRLGARTTFSAEALVHHAVFPGDIRTFLGEQARVRHFPALISRIPELRRVLAWRRYFLNARTAAFDAAVVSALAAAAASSPIPLVGLIPYLVLGRREVKRFSLRAPEALRYSAAVVARDAIGFAALVRGSLEARSPLF